MTRRLNWLDILKGLAIIAVVVDHTHLPVVRYSIYSVSMFFLILGFNAYNSIERSCDSSIIERLKSCSRFIILYSIATIIYCFSRSEFSIQLIYEKIVYFSSSAPFYFCAIYIQISLISGLVYRLIKTACGTELLSIRAVASCAILLVIFYFISRLLQNVLLFPNLHGGGKYLFGSTYLFLTVLGMVFARFISAIENKRRSVFFLSLLVLTASPFYINKIWYNPPAFMTCVYTVSIFLVVASAGFTWKNIASRFIMLLGKYSIHIFLYHLLVIQYLGTGSKYVTFMLALLVPVLIGVVIDFCLKDKKSLPSFR